MSGVAILPGTPPVIVTGENAAEAARQAGLAQTRATAAQTAAAQAENARDAALATANVFTGQAAGEAGTVTDEVFAVASGGIYRFYKRTSGGSSELLPAVPVNKITAATGDPNTSTQWTRVAELESGAGPWDKTFILRQKNGALSNLDLHGGGTGAQIRGFDQFGELEWAFGDGNQFYSLKSGGYWAALYDDTGEPGDPEYHRVCHPPNQVPHMESVDPDVPLARVTRTRSVGGQAHLYMDMDGNGTRLDLGSGAIQWPRPDAPVVVGDVRSVAPMGAIATADFPIRQRPFNAGGLYGVMVDSTDVATIGAGWRFMQINGGIAGQNGNVLVQNEAGTLLRIGNGASHNTTINAAGQTVFEIAGANVAYITATGLHPLADASKNLGSSGLQWNNLYVANNPIVGSDERLKEQIEDVPVAWLRAWAKVSPKRFKYRDAVAEKGGEARWHVGYIAQDILAAFASEKVDAAEVGIVCLQKWEDEWADEIKDVSVPAKTVTEERKVATKLRDSKHRPLSRIVKVKRTIPAHTIRQATGKKIKVREAGEFWSVRYEQAEVLTRALDHARAAGLL